MPQAREKRPKKRKRKQTFSAAKAVKSNARDVIGAPPPTRLATGRRTKANREGKHKPTFGALLADE